MSELETLPGASIAPEPTLTLDDVDELEAFEGLRDRLLDKLRRQRAVALDFYAWYQGQQEPPHVPRDYARAYGRLRDMARTAWARLIVDATAERLEVQGVTTTAGEAADARAWELLQANRVDSDQRDTYVEAFVAGVSYVSIAGSGDAVRITPETCLEVTHEHAPGDRRSVGAALKLYPLLVDGAWLAERYTPSLVLVWTALYRDTNRSPLGDRARAPWDEPLVFENTLGVVPFVPFENRPAAATAGASELDELVPIMERIQELEL